MNISHRVLQCFDLKFKELRESPDQPEQGFSGASVIRLTGEFGDFALRKWPKGQLPKLRIVGLHALLAHVFQTGVTQVAVPVANVKGQTLTEFHADLWQLEPWMPGIADFHGDPTTQRLKAAMHCLADWHNSAARFQCPANANEWFYSRAKGTSPACVERATKLQVWLKTRISKIQQAVTNDMDSQFRRVAGSIVSNVIQVGPNVLADLERGTRIPVPLLPCLRDIWHDHVLFTGPNVTGLIDSSSCRTENVASDLSRLLGSFVGSDVDQFNSAVDWYAQRRPLSDSERWLIGVLDRSSVVLSSLNWLARRYEVSPQAKHIPWDRVLVRLKTFEQRLQTFGS